MITKVAMEDRDDNVLLFRPRWLSGNWKIVPSGAIGITNTSNSEMVLFT